MELPRLRFVVGARSRWRLGRACLPRRFGLAAAESFSGEGSSSSLRSSMKFRFVPLGVTGALRSAAAPRRPDGGGPPRAASRTVPHTCASRPRPYGSSTPCRHLLLQSLPSRARIVFDCTFPALILPRPAPSPVEDPSGRPARSGEPMLGGRRQSPPPLAVRAACWPLTAQLMHDCGPSPLSA